MRTATAPPLRGDVPGRMTSDRGDSAPACTSRARRAGESIEPREAPPAEIARQFWGPAVSVVVCTRNRGRLVTSAIRSVLDSVGVRLELIVVDQSDSDDTEHAVAPLRGDPRLHYIRSSTVGVSRARNIGLRHATNDIVLITDDDVTVPPDWARNFHAAIEPMSRVAVAFCRVDAADHDNTKGFVPDHVIEQPLLVRSLLSKSRARGIGAGMAVRRNAVLELGGFDPQLGPGAPLRSGEDRDLAARALTAGWWLYQTPTATVVHHGFRTWSEGRDLTRRDWYGIGAAYAKLLKCGHIGVLVVLAHEVAYIGLIKPAAHALSRHGTLGLRRLLYFIHGMVDGLRTPVDRRRSLFRASTRDRSRKTRPPTTPHRATGLAPCPSPAVRGRSAHEPPRHHWSRFVSGITRTNGTRTPLTSTAPSTSRSSKR
jgi:glycosyltransferase involved in cell wall biosynthesis